jgi:hypothetical protein
VPEQARADLVLDQASQFAGLAGTPLAVDSGTAYAIFDGLFQQALLRHLAGRPEGA